MRLDELSLAWFRNYAQFAGKWNVAGALLWGENGVGKSNLLEAIHLLAVGRSHRTLNDREIVAIGQPALTVRGEGESEREGRVDVEISVRIGGTKRAVVNGKEEGRLSAIVGRLGAVMVAPEDMEVTRGAPERRRRFLDQLLCQIRPAHIAALQAYGRALKQRNQALREEREARAPAGFSEAWNAPLCEWGTKVREHRASLVARLARLAHDLFGEVSARAGDLVVAYPAADDDMPAALARVAAGEARRGMTLTGPHRDDLVIELDGKDVRSFGSRGQQRAATFSLKMASAVLFREERGEPPILLLDDIFAELDKGRADRLAALLHGSGFGGQVFATATTAAELMSRFGGVAPYRVIGGAIEEGA